MADIEEYRSHPDKSLIKHTENVRKEIKNLTGLPLAELSGLVHDIGKLNTNFQNKLDDIDSGYSSHAYLSAFLFYLFAQVNKQSLEEEFSLGEVDDYISAIAIIAHHHGNLPNFDHILSERECERLFNFISQKPFLPVSDFFSNFLQTDLKQFEEHLSNKQAWKKFSQLGTKPKYPLKTFFETQFSFASLIQADKKDAGEYEFSEEISTFCKIYNNCLEDHIAQFPDQDKPLNQLRTQIREEGVKAIRSRLNNSDQRVFSLTAPTGSGKTIMLLSLAGEIIKKIGPKRIIYTLPFLSITEQVEKDCKKIFSGYNEYVTRIDSKSENKQFQQLQEEADNNPTKIKDLISAQFALDTFSAPFIITTFVRVFETFVSNKNSTLIKLPNFANTIFLIDEIQSLPPRLYTFFVALLQSFCKKFNSYAILSTATMPDFSLEGENKQKAKAIFSDYKEPEELVSHDHFKNELFNRYTSVKIEVSIDIEELSEKLLREKDAILVILNTIDDTKLLYDDLKDEEDVILLNTHFTPNDRKTKIEKAKKKLGQKKKFILISTQLIEAGVNIDFPIVYRDMAHLASIVQSSGRCNRHGQLPNKGKVVLFELYSNSNRRANLIYRGKDRKLLNKTIEILKNQSFQEKELFEAQRNFFSFITTKLAIGEHEQKKPKAQINFFDDLKKLAFENMGKFRLIDEGKYGQEEQFYVPESKSDTKLYRLKELRQELLNIDSKDFEKKKYYRIKISQKLKDMSGQIVQLRIKQKDIPPLVVEECFDIKLIGNESYNSKTGVRLGLGNQII